MFCFPYPRHSALEPIRIPLIARTQYLTTGKIGSWNVFKTKLDAETQNIRNAAYDRQEGCVFSHTLISAIQSWLFFGLASEALGRDIKHEEFAGVDPYGLHLSFDLRIPEWYWRELKARWSGQDNSFPTPQFQAERANLKIFYGIVQTSVTLLDALANGQDDDKLTQILLSIHMLLYLVADVLDCKTLKVIPTTVNSASTKFLKHRMIKNGWCEKRLNFLDASPMFYPALYFISSLTPPRVNAEDHSGCSSERCLVISVLSEPLHRTDDCLCEEIVVPVDRVNTIVASGGIPLVKITQSRYGQTELQVVPYTPSIRFVAISHVWADQQFGSSQNRLPKCQVGYLQEVLSSLPANLIQWVGHCLCYSRPSSRNYEYFWLDSFCIPQAAECADLRSQAIESMNFIYAAAAHTLVFDKRLQALDAGKRRTSLILGPTYYSPHDENLLDVVASLYASNWMGRAWTLQEGALSGDVIFPLHGSLVHLKLLRPYHGPGFGQILDHLVTSMPTVFRRLACKLLLRSIQPNDEVTTRLQGKSEPFRDHLRLQLFTHMKMSLNVEERNAYARTPVGGFIYAKENYF